MISMNHLPCGCLKCASHLGRLGRMAGQHDSPHVKDANEPTAR